MNLSSGVSLGQLLLAFSVMLVTSGVAWGGLLQRVKTLEREVEALAGISGELATIAERTKNIDERSKSTAEDIGKLKDWLLNQHGFDGSPANRRRAKP